MYTIKYSTCHVQEISEFKAKTKGPTIEKSCCKCFDIVNGSLFRQRGGHYGERAWG